MILATLEKLKENYPGIGPIRKGAINLVNYSIKAYIDEGKFLSLSLELLYKLILIRMLKGFVED